MNKMETLVINFLQEVPESLEQWRSKKPANRQTRHATSGKCVHHPKLYWLLDKK